MQVDLIAASELSPACSNRLILGLAVMTSPTKAFRERRQQTCDICRTIYDNFGICDRLRDEHRYVLICEFCDRLGPVPLQQEPREFERADELALRLLSVAFPDDSVLLSYNNTRGELTLSAYGTLTDPLARGFVRSFCVVLLDNQLLHGARYSSIQRALALVTTRRNALKGWNSRVFRTFRETNNSDLFYGFVSPESAALSAGRSPSVDSVNGRMCGRKKAIVRDGSTASGSVCKGMARSQSLASVKRAWKFSELTGTNRAATHDWSDKTPSHKLTLPHLCKHYADFVVSLIYASLRGLCIVVIGGRPVGPLFSLLERLLGQRAFEVTGNYLNTSSLAANKFIFHSSVDIKIDRMIWYYCCLWDTYNGMLFGPSYKGKLSNAVRIAGSLLSDEVCESLIQAEIADLLQWTYLLPRMHSIRLPVSISADDLSIIKFHADKKNCSLKGYTTPIRTFKAPPESAFSAPSGAF